VSVSAITRLLALYRETGSYEPRPNPNGRKPALSAEQLEGIRRKIDEQPDITLRELIEAFSLPVSAQALCNTINKKLGLCRKKNATRSASMHNNYCRVCGYKLTDPSWGIDGNSPTWEICPCCGTEFGYEDCTLMSVRKRREEWILKGKKWFDIQKMPINWDCNIQLDNIPKPFL
ncbi:MAG: hypothetical protein LBP58_03595, partial [Azoarcus sp.]|jgi:hypothetical protein|nr:hypothetical protein [Azoarcus sp.]